MAKKILLIVRASTVQQEIESQKKELIQYVSHFGYSESQCVIIAVAGASARKKNQKYLQMLEDVKSTITNDKEIEAVGLWSLDRLGRVDDSLIEMKNWFISHKIQLICKSPSLVLLNDDGTVNGGAEIAYGVFSSLVKQQTEDLFNKWQRGKKRNSEQGRCNGNKNQRFGYKLDENNYVIPNTDKEDTVNNGMSEVEIVKMIYDMYATEEYSTSSLWLELRDRGFTYRDTNRPLTIEMVNRILNTTAYIGWTDDNSGRSHRKFPKILDEELWNKVKVIRDKKNMMNGKTKETVHHNLCTGLIVCPVCGSHYIAVNNQYICLHRGHGKRYKALYPDCSSISIRKEIADAFCWSFITDIHTRVEEGSLMETLKKYDDKEKILRQKLNQLVKEEDKLKASLERAKDLYIQGDITAKKLESIKASFSRKRYDLWVKFEQIDREINDTKEKKLYAMNRRNMWQNLENALDELEKADDVERQRLAKAYIKEITVKKEDEYAKVIITSKEGEVRTYYYKSKARFKDKTKAMFVLEDGEFKPWNERLIKVEATN